MSNHKHISREQRLTLKTEKDRQEQALHRALRTSAKRHQRFLYVIQELKKEEFNQSLARQDRRYSELSGFLNDQNWVRNKAKLLEGLEVLTLGLERKCPDWFKDTDLLIALLMVGRYRKAWRQPLEGWKSKAKNDYGKFMNLVSYLFLQYEAPRFLYHAFFHPQDYPHLELFIYLGTGGSMKEVRFDIKLTKKMQHYFLHAPEGLRVTQAVRWAQVCGLGGDPLLAHRIAYSRLGYADRRRDETLWEDFVRILVQGGMFNLDKLTELIDYVRTCTQQNPDYSLKGRTLPSLLRQSNEWHHQMVRAKSTKQAVTWQGVDWEPFTVTEGKEENPVIYQMVELLSNKELSEEGQRMHHCVASYADDCFYGKTRIFSLRCTRFGNEERLATIELDLRNRRIVQAKYRYNQKISDKARELLEQWAAQQKLVLSKYL
ncbi:MAG: PcfJ domain-containing protein [Spirosomataceae bacterium]